MMPVSTDVFDRRVSAWLQDWIANNPGGEYYDIGPGEGKYGRLVRELDPGARLVAIEIDPGYIETYHLAELYDQVVCADAAEYFFELGDLYSVGVFFLGDVIEHMRKSKGLDLLHYLVYHCYYILLTFPTAYKQGVWEGHRSEMHQSSWCEDDFSWVEHQYWIDRSNPYVPQNLCIVRGYR